MAVSRHCSAVGQGRINMADSCHAVNLTDPGNNSQRDVFSAASFPNAVNDFSLQALMVELSFAGYYQIGIFQQPVKPDQIQNRFNARLQLAAKQSFQSPGNAAGSSAAYQVVFYMVA